MYVYVADTGSAKIQPKRKYTTTHLLQQQRRMKTRSSPRLAKMSSSKQEASTKEKGSAKRKLDLGAEPDGDEVTAESDNVEVLLNFIH